MEFVASVISVVDRAAVKVVLIVVVVLAIVVMVVLLVLSLSFSLVVAVVVGGGGGRGAVMSVKVVDVVLRAGVGDMLTFIAALDCCCGIQRSVPESSRLGKQRPA
jgi:hypothetical protein